MNIVKDTNSLAKKAAGKAAADLVQSGMLVGLGTGTTATYFISSLIERCKQGLKICAVATSERSVKMAKEGNIPLADSSSIISIDLTVDGADEIDTQKRMIKGGGGALLREKIVASISKEVIIVVDSTKVVEHLGKFPLPLEITPFAQAAILHKLDVLGYRATIRKEADGQIYRTDNGNWIADIALPYPCLHPEKINAQLKEIPGILETGFFFHLANHVIIGFSDGTVEIRQ